MFKSKYLIANVLFFLSMLSCAKKSADSWEFALVPGSYLLSGPVCMSNNAAPVYKTISQRINLFDFDSINRHALEIQSSSSVRTITDGSCTIKITQPVDTNRNGFFANQVARIVAFEPEGCTINITIGNETFSAGNQSSEGLQNRDSRTRDLLFNIETTESGFHMISADIPALNELWSEYGCANPDRIKWSGHSE